MIDHKPPLLMGLAQRVLDVESRFIGGEVPFEEVEIAWLVYMDAVFVHVRYPKGSWQDGRVQNLEKFAREPNEESSCWHRLEYLFFWVTTAYCCTQAGECPTCGRQLYSAAQRMGGTLKELAEALRPKSPDYGESDYVSIRVEMTYGS